MNREEAVKELNKAFEPAFANYIITALQEGATVSDKGEDAISRNAMLDYQQYLHGKMSNEENHKLWEFIKDLPSVTPAQKWIPCSERLPNIKNRTEKYLVTLKSGTISIAMFVECDGEHWWNHYDDVVAWMPLPEPYNAGMEFEETKRRCEHD